MSPDGQGDLRPRKPSRPVTAAHKSDPVATVNAADSVAASDDVRTTLFEGEDAIPSEIIPSSEAYTLLRGNGHHRDRPLEVVLRWIKRPHHGTNGDSTESRRLPQ
jgi:hypothetical protein